MNSVYIMMCYFDGWGIPLCIGNYTWFLQKEKSFISIYTGRWGTRKKGASLSPTTGATQKDWGLGDGRLPTVISNINRKSTINTHKYKTWKSNINTHICTYVRKVRETGTRWIPYGFLPGRPGRFINTEHSASGGGFSKQCK
jgi:hypothetical protein